MPPDRRSVARELEERVKELNCLFGVSEIVERAGGSLDQILGETVEILPPSWEHPEVACARIVLNDREFRSAAHGDSPWKQSAAILVHGREAGIVEVSYLEERPARTEGPFTMEERKLLNAVAARLGHVVERLTAEEIHRETEAELRSRMTHLSRVNTMGEMASSIAHEVNQPLTAIATYAQACRRLVEAGATDDAELLDVLRRIADEALRAGNIVHRLRLLVKRKTRSPGRCDLIPLLEEIAPMAVADARLHDIRVNLVLPPSLPPILADGIQIQQVILNLIRNGIDAMAESPPGDRELEVRVGRAQNTEAQVSVSDRGCGLAEEAETGLFQPFFSTKEGGMGMGLSISRSIISAHGGRLWFTRNREGGTTFHFTLPFAPEAPHE